MTIDLSSNNQSTYWKSNSPPNFDFFKINFNSCIANICFNTDKENTGRLSALTNERLNGGNLAQVLEQLVDRVVVLRSNGILMVQQQLTGHKHSMLVIL